MSKKEIRELPREFAERPLVEIIWALLTVTLEGIDGGSRPPLREQPASMSFRFEGQPTEHVFTLSVSHPE